MGRGGGHTNAPSGVREQMPLGGADQCRRGQAGKPRGGTANVLGNKDRLEHRCIVFFLRVRLPFRAGLVFVVVVAGAGAFFFALVVFDVQLILDGCLHFGTLAGLGQHALPPCSVLALFFIAISVLLVAALRLLRSQKSANRTAS